MIFMTVVVCCDVCQNPDTAELTHVPIKEDGRTLDMYAVEVPDGWTKRTSTTVPALGPEPPLSVAYPGGPRLVCDTCQTRAPVGAEPPRRKLTASAEQAERELAWIRSGGKG